MTRTERTTILFVGDDPPLAYLIERYAQRSGHRLHLAKTLPAPGEVAALAAAVVWFSSLASLEAAQPRPAEAVSNDVPLVVWATVTDTARAYELGADYCALHPFTYQDFLTALAAVGAATTAESATGERRASAA